MYQIVYASTGKAIRPFTPDTYAMSKKVSEWLIARETQRGNIRGSGACFTHVVDNSIIHQRLQYWIATNSPIRLHSPDNLFYMQLARESAHLLLNAGLEVDSDRLTLQAIRDLEWPINLLDLALGAIARAGASTPIYLSGYESGYEEHPWPGLYDPIHSFEVSPLINSIEAPQATPSVTCPQVDRFPVEVAASSTFTKRLQTLGRLCVEGAPAAELHRAKDALSWAMLDSRLRRVPRADLEHTAQRMQAMSQQQPMIDEHAKINQAIYKAVSKSESS